MILTRTKSRYFSGQRCNGIGEELQSIGRWQGILGKSGPVRVVYRRNEPLRVWHQAKNSAGRVAHSGYALWRSIRVGWILLCWLAGWIDILQDHLTIGLQLLERFGARGHESPLSMSARQGDGRDPIQEDRFAGFGLHLNPSRFKLAAHIVSERSGWPHFSPCTVRQQARGNQHLKTIADSKNQSAMINKLAQSIGQREMNSGGPDSSGTQVIAIRKTARKCQDLKS